MFFDSSDACQAIRLFEPDALVLALGFDIYERISAAAVSTAGFAELGQRVELNVPTWSCRKAATTWKGWPTR